ncbi:hypothetical protein CL632_03205 [bacterium]|nr:hypothetical protein [bacterium]
MKNKKAMRMFGIITAAIISMIILLVFVGPIIKGIFVDKQVAFAGGKTEEITIDCDGDTHIGFSDICPCNKDKHEKDDLDTDLSCGGVEPPEAASICPELCKR